MADLIIAKHRNGELGRTQLRFKGEYTKFVTPDPSELKELARNAGKSSQGRDDEEEPPREDEDESYPEEMPDDGMVFSDDDYGGIDEE